MQTKGLVSVIIPFYNSEKYILEAIESVCAQTYPDWELLLVDDGSQDSSGEIVRLFMSRFPEKIRCLEHEGHANRGTSATINLGLRNANGEYIALLDSDDVWLPHKLHDQVEIARSYPEAGVIYGDTLYWFSWTGKEEDLHRDYFPYRSVPQNTLLQPPDLLIKCLQGTTAVPCPCSLFFRYSVLDQTGMFEEEFRYIYTDQAFYTKLFLSVPVFAASEYWDKYRRHPDSNVSIIEKTNRVASTRDNYLRWVLRFLTQQGLENSKVWRVTQRQIWLNQHPTVKRLQVRSRNAAIHVIGSFKTFLSSRAE